MHSGVLHILPQMVIYSSRKSWKRVALLGLRNYSRRVIRTTQNQEAVWNASEPWRKDRLHQGFNNKKKSPKWEVCPPTCQFNLLAHSEPYKCSWWLDWTPRASAHHLRVVVRNFLSIHTVYSSVKLLFSIFFVQAPGGLTHDRGSIKIKMYH